MIETMKDRLDQYSSLKDEKNCGIICPVCYKPFANNYSLSNHFLKRGYNEGPKYFDSDHEKYFLRYKEETKL